MSTLETILSELASASAAARSAWAALNSAQEALLSGSQPSKVDLDRIAIASQRAQIAAHAESVVRYRLARYRIEALGWHKAPREDRAIRKPGPPPWAIERFAAHHGISL